MFPHGSAIAARLWGQQQLAVGPGKRMWTSPTTCGAKFNLQCRHG